MKASNPTLLSLTRIPTGGLLLFAFLFIALSAPSSGQVIVKKLRAYKFSIGAEYRSYDQKYKFLGEETRPGVDAIAADPDANPPTLAVPAIAEAIISSEHQVKQNSQNAKGFFVRVEKRNLNRGLALGLEFTAMRGKGKFPLVSFDPLDDDTTDTQRETLAYKLEIGNAYELSLILKMAHSKGINLLIYPYLKAGIAIMKVKETFYAAGTAGSTFTTGETADLSGHDFNDTEDFTSLAATHLSVRRTFNSTLEGLKLAVGGEVKFMGGDNSSILPRDSRISMFLEYFFVTYNDGGSHKVNKFKGHLKKFKQNGIAMGISASF